MERFPNNENSEQIDGYGKESDIVDENVLSSDAKKMLMDSLRNDLNNRDVNGGGDDEIMTDEYYDRVKKILSDMERSSENN